MTRRPGWRECTVYRRPGLRGMPLALSLSEGLGLNLRLSKDTSKQAAFWLIIRCRVEAPRIGMKVARPRRQKADWAATCGNTSSLQGLRCEFIFFFALLVG